MRSLRYLNTVLTILAVLLSLQLWTTWTSSPASLPTVEQSAQAQSRNSTPPPPGGIPNAGAQRQQMVQQLESQNRKFDELMTLLKSGQVRVRVEAAAREERRD